MKEPAEFDDDVFNRPRVVRMRTVNALSLAFFSAGLLLIVSGALWRDLRLLAGGIGALALSGVLREWLARGGRLAAADIALEAFRRHGADLNYAHVARLLALLRRWENLEQRRGSPEFDPWAVHMARQDIRAMIERDPALERLFHV